MHSRKGVGVVVLVGGGGGGVVAIIYLICCIRMALIYKSRTAFVMKKGYTGRVYRNILFQKRHLFDFFMIRLYTDGEQLVRTKKLYLSQPNSFRAD